MKRRHSETHLASSLILVSSHNTQERLPIFWEDQHIHTDGNIREPFGRGLPHQMGAPQQRAQQTTPHCIKNIYLYIAHFPVKLKRGRCRHWNNGYTTTQT